MCKCNPMIRSIYCLKCDPRGATAYQADIDKYKKDLPFQAKDEVVHAVCTDLLDRSQVGIDKYKTTLADNKGGLRYWLNHAYEECLDQANYLKRAIMELDKNETLR